MYRQTTDIDVRVHKDCISYMPRTRFGREVCDKCLRGHYRARAYNVPLTEATASHNRLVQEGARLSAIGVFSHGAIHHA